MGCQCSSPGGTRLPETDFILKAEIARGGTGKVYYCSHKKYKQRLACKVINKKKLMMNASRSEREELEDSLKNEITALTELKHPSIVQLYHMQEQQDCLYLVMELMQGGELFDYIIEKDTLSEHEASEIARQVADGVAHCHRHNIAHRDLKPENLLLKEKGSLQCKIADFGFCKAMTKQTKTLLGTPGYVCNLPALIVLLLL
jgi:serine/threonine protein kinase